MAEKVTAKEAVEKALILYDGKGEECPLCKQPVHGKAAALVVPIGPKWMNQEFKRVVDLGCAELISARAREVIECQKRA